MKRLPDRRLRGRVRSFWTAVENNPAAIVVTDARGTIEYVNPQFSRMTGWGEEEAIGRNPRFLKSGTHSPAFYQDLWETILDGRIWQGEFRNRRKDGGLYWESASIAPVKDREGRIIRFVAMKQDVTEAKRSREELIRAKEEAEAANEAKSSFLATMSHEIRTPMNGIIGMTELLVGTDLSAEQREYLEIVRTSAHALLHIINEILDFSKIQAGKMEIERIPFDVRALADGAVDMFALRARDKGLDLACEIDPSVPAAVLGDPTRLRQVLFNLLDNAVKFTERGSVRLRIEGRPLPGGAFELTSSVSDTGIGIPEEKQERLFRSFEQLDGSMTRKYGGTGLGLVIARRLVELMGGSISFRSREGVGSRFWVRFPLEVAGRAEAPPAPSLSPPLSRGAGGGVPADLPDYLRVLLAEDHPISRRLVATLFGKRGWELDVAVDGRQAVERFRSGTYDLVLMDIQMPEMDGLAATREIRRVEAERGGERTPVVALTAYALPGDFERCLAAGMDDYVGKPIRVGELFSSIARVLRRGRRDPGQEGDGTAEEP